MAGSVQPQRSPWLTASSIDTEPIESSTAPPTSNGWAGPSIIGIVTAASTNVASTSTVPNQ